MLLLERGDGESARKIRGKWARGIGYPEAEMLSGRFYKLACDEFSTIVP